MKHFSPYRPDYFKGFNSEYFQDAQFVEDSLSGFPERWKRRLSDAHREKHFTNRFVANSELREVTAKLSGVRLPLDASDGDIRTRAAELSAQGWKLAEAFFTLESLRMALDRHCQNVGLRPAGVRDQEICGGIYLVWDDKMDMRAAIKRMTCKDWWCRGLRRLHAKAVESTAIELGYVNRARDLYVSHETFARRTAQLRRNKKMMEETRLRNELDQEFSLAELAACGVGDKAIRRGELMTRLDGFDRLSLKLGYDRIFLTMTAPSEYHRYGIIPGTKRVFENPKYSGKSPREAQDFMCKAWSLIRAKFQRMGIEVCGFRVAEPHHDACPHWHMLLFVAPELSTGRAAVPRLLAVVRHYLLDRAKRPSYKVFLAKARAAGVKGIAAHAARWHHEAIVSMSAAERADKARRLQALNHKRIDPKEGSAVGYMAKYISKNIDGFMVGEDLFGNPAVETCKKVDAWASTWNIRQFQQIGGAPVGVWRELRRIKELLEGVPEHLRRAWEAVNRVEGEDGTKRADWAAYLEAQGGISVGRGARIKLDKEQTGEVGRYGELVAPKSVGVATVGMECYRDGITPDRIRVVEWFVKSVRHVWEVVKGAARRVTEAADFRRLGLV